MGDFFTEAIVVSMLAATVRIATPLLLAALGELVAERAGILNLGVEGTMLMGAFSAFLFTYVSGSLIVGLVAGMLTGMMMSLVMVVMAATLKVEQVVTGLSLNLLAVGLSAYLYKQFFGETGTLPTVPVMPTVDIPGLSSIPYLGEILFSQKALTYFAFFMVPVVWFMLYRTKWGLEIRCLGENPKVIDTKGLSVTARQYAAVIFGGAMSGLGGAFVTIGSTERFVPEITAGSRLAGHRHRHRRQLASEVDTVGRFGVCLSGGLPAASPRHRRENPLSVPARPALCDCNRGDDFEPATFRRAFPLGSPLF